MNCIIIEDQPPAQRILKKYIEDIGSLVLQGTFTNAIQAMDFLQNQEVDLIFLDIHLPKISGIDFLKTIQDSPYIILTTAFSDYALESYEFKVVDYLLKPFSFQRFIKAINKVPKPLVLESNPQAVATTPEPRKTLFIKSGYELLKVVIEDILYIKSDTDYTEIWLHNKKLLSTESLRYWEEELHAQQFVRIHKSYLLNTSKIEKIAGSRVYLNPNTTIPIGRAYKDSFFELLKG